MEIACKPRSAQKHMSIKTKSTGARVQTGGQQRLSKQTKQHAQEKREKTNDATDEVVVITTTTTTTTTTATKEHTATKESMAENKMHETGKCKL